MNDIRSYHAPNLNLQGMAQALADWFRFQKYDIQSQPLPDGVILQAKQYEGWRSAMGVSSALNIILRPNKDQLVVEMGAGKWGDKAVAGTVGMFLLWPLAFTAAYGAWQQSKLPDRVFAFIQQYISSGGQMMPGVAAAQAIPPSPMMAPPSATPAAAPAMAAAPAAVAPAAAATAAGFCAKCGTAYVPDAVFCSKCGNKVG